MIYSKPGEIRHVGVIWLPFPCSPTSFDYICINTMKHLLKLDWKSDFSSFSLTLSEVHVCSFLNLIHRSYHLCSLLSVGVVINIWRHSPIPFMQCFFLLMFALWYSLNHVSFKSKGFNEENEQLTTHLPYVNTHWWYIPSLERYTKGLQEESIYLSIYIRNLDEQT